MGLDLERDGIIITEIGDPVEIIGALEAGRIDGAVLSRSQCEQLTGKGFSILFDLLPFGMYGAPDALVATATFLRDRPEVIQGIVASLTEAAALILSPLHRLAALEAMKAEPRINDNSTAEIALFELSRIIVRKPYPSVERLSDMQRIMSAAKPTVSRVSIQDLIHDRLVRNLDEEGFIDRTYVAYASS